MILHFENSQFLRALTQKVLKVIKKSFEYAHWNTKIYWISLVSLWNSTTVTMLLYNNVIIVQMTRITTSYYWKKHEKVSAFVKPILLNQFLDRTIQYLKLLNKAHKNTTFEALWTSEVSVFISCNLLMFLVLNRSILAFFQTLLSIAKLF